MGKALNTAMAGVVEYSIALTLSLLFICVLLYAVKILYNRNQQLGDNVIASLNENTKALNELSDRIQRG